LRASAKRRPRAGFSEDRVLAFEGGRCGLLGSNAAEGPPPADGDHRGHASADEQDERQEKERGDRHRKADQRNSDPRQPATRS